MAFLWPLLQRFCCCASPRVSDTALSYELAQHMVAPRSAKRDGRLLACLVSASLQDHPVAVAALNLREGLLLASDEPHASLGQKGLVREFGVLQELVLGKNVGLEPVFSPPNVRTTWLRWVDDVIVDAPPSNRALPKQSTATSFFDCMAHFEAQSPGARMYALGSLLRACAHDGENSDPIVVRSLDRQIDLGDLRQQCPSLPVDVFDVACDAGKQKDTCPLCDRLSGWQPTYLHMRYIQYRGDKKGDQVGSIGNCIELSPTTKRRYKGNLYFWKVSRGVGPADSLTSDDFLMGCTWDNGNGRQNLGTRTPSDVTPLLNQKDIESQILVCMWVYTRKNWCPGHNFLFRHLRLAYPAVTEIALTTLLLFHPQTAELRSDAEVFSFAEEVMSKL